MNVDGSEKNRIGGIVKSNKTGSFDWALCHEPWVAQCERLYRSGVRRRYIQRCIKMPALRKECRESK